MTTKTRSKRVRVPFIGGLSLYAINITDKKQPHLPLMVSINQANPLLNSEL